MIRRRTVGAALLVLNAIACSSGGAPHDGGDAADPDALGEDGTTHGYSLPGFPGGNDFFYLLPPSFSPFLPLYGQGATREPAAFYDTTSDYYFSYAFVWWIEGTPDLSTSALGNDLRLYYTGLCPSQTVAVTLGEPAATSQDAGSLVARRAGTLDAGTCFDNPVPAAAIEVSTYDCPDHHAVVVLVSPQPVPGPIWTELDTIRDGFLCW
jgi:hypothetical protein